MTEKYIESLSKLLSEPITDSYSLKAWKSKAINVLIRIYGNDSKQEQQVNQIEYRNYPSFGTYDRNSGDYKNHGGGNNIEHCRKLAYSLINGFIDELNSFGLPDKKETNTEKGINITVNQSSTQDVKVNLNVILSAFQDELNGKQLKEIQEIVEGKEDSETKREKVINKIKSFGSDVMSNILANLLTNPNLFG